MELKTGATFKNVHMPKYSFRIDSVEKDKNELEVCITGGNESRWFETWNLAHTIIGFEREEYHSLNSQP